CHATGALSSTSLSEVAGPARFLGAGTQESWIKGQFGKAGAAAAIGMSWRLGDQPSFLGRQSARAAARKARILARSFSPARLSTPEETSTAAAPEIRTASGSNSAVSPPDSIHGQRQVRPAIRPQSNERPLPPGNAWGRLGGLASNRRRSAVVS